jgi:hypothetical protein
VVEAVAAAAREGRRRGRRRRGRREEGGLESFMR